MGRWTVLKRRMAALEDRLGEEMVLLHFSDGSQRKILASFDHWQALAAVDLKTEPQDEATAELLSEAKAVQRAVRITGAVDQKQDGQMFYLLQALYNSPDGPDSEAA